MAKLFVGQVPNGTTDAKMREVFGPYGTVTDVFFLKDRLTDTPKGCAFVTFAQEDQAQAAMDALNETYTLEGAKRTMIINLAGQEKGTDKSEWKLYVGMLSRSTTEDEVRAMFEPYGIITEIYMMTDRETGASKGQAFIKFSNRDEASRAINALNEKMKDKDAPTTMQVRFAHTKQERSLRQQPANNQFPMGSFGGFPPAGLGGMGMGQGFGAAGVGQGFGAGAAFPGADMSSYGFRVPLLVTMVWASKVWEWGGWEWDLARLHTNNSQQQQVLGVIFSKVPQGLICLSWGFLTFTVMPTSPLFLATLEPF